MGCENCNRKAKIVFGVAGAIALAGGIVIIVAMTTGAESVKVGFEVENKLNPTVKATEGKGGLGYALHFKASEHANCETIKDATKIKDPSGNLAFMLGTCHEAQADWEKKNDPPLRKLGHFGLNTVQGSQAKVYGDYSITSTTNLWVVDSGEELGEAVGGIFAAMGMMVLAIVLFVISCILCCVGGCCCMGPEQGKQGGQPGQVIGQAQPSA